MPKDQELADDIRRNLLKRPGGKGKDTEDERKGKGKSHNPLAALPLGLAIRIKRQRGPGNRACADREVAGPFAVAPGAPWVHQGGKRGVCRHWNCRVPDAAGFETMGSHDAP